MRGVRHVGQFVISIEVIQLGEIMCLQGVKSISIVL